MGDHADDMSMWAECYEASLDEPPLQFTCRYCGTVVVWDWWDNVPWMIDLNNAVHSCFAVVECAPSAEYLAGLLNIPIDN